MACPETPREDRPELLGFHRRPMVAWFDPRQLSDTAVRAGLSLVFGAYADKREVQAALKSPKVYDEFSGRDELWVDYVADLGDGFDSTYSVARALAEPTRELRSGEGALATRRGQLLVLGGDQVYPTAKREEYQDRFVGPYRSALPCVENGEPPRMFAIPGNHDWYDGLTSFTRLFCQGRWIGGWKTQQSRSYFAIKLPHNWWLWGIDIQLAADIDLPQLEYFRAVASGALAGERRDDYLRGHRIILCTASPSWVYTAYEGPEAYHNLDFFERRVIREHGGELAVTLTGDLHHYTRYADERGRQKFTSGGGGAYLYGTHDLPKSLELGEEKTVYRQTEDSFPKPRESRRLARKAWRFAFQPRNFSFAGFLGGFYLLYAWLLQSASKRLGAEGPTAGTDASSFMERIQSVPFSLEGLAAVADEYVSVIAHSPVSVIFLIAVVGGLIGFCGARSKGVKVAVGGSHGIAHLAVNIGLIWGLAHINLVYLNLSVDSPVQVGLFLLEMLVFGGALGGLVMGLYLVLSNQILGLHTNEVFSAQPIADFKNFLRLHIDRSGTLRIYPIGVRRVVKKWRLNPQAKGGEPWFEPAGGAIETELIEGPIVIAGRRDDR